MFPVVFQMPSSVEPALRNDPGSACSSLMAAAAEVPASQVTQLMHPVKYTMLSLLFDFVFIPV